MAELYPLPEPTDEGLLDVGDGNRIFWQTFGNPDGKPAVMLHGGPGTGCTPAMARGHDPARYRVVLFDQRGSGRSTPHASDPAADMSVNTTWHLVADMEALREHLGIDRWQLGGGSWGSTLALAYAERHPDRVSEIVLSAITSGRRWEAEWLYRGVARFFPEEFQRFESGVAPEYRDGNLAIGYSWLMESSDPAVREKAARDWCAWEDAVVSLEPGAKPNVYSNRPDDALLAFVRICTHYVAHDAWLDEGQLIRDADRLAGIPGVLIHGRLDLSAPLDTAWELAQAWPDARLVAIADAGHQGSASKREAQLAALDGFADRRD
ncbi:MAG TPA: prolyl aminopeptidase [Jatrophihabitans sp.]|jgi:proline iminopeptidase|uniref:prolyl aminopeptidase n=1 Tax=Jatrophihabitans sp. TaxID=1932789 RepID=UPI002EED30E1